MVYTRESGSLATMVSTDTMQAVCTPVAQCWDRMHCITSKSYCSLGNDSCKSTGCAEEKGAKAQSRSCLTGTAYAERKLLLRRYDLLRHHGLSQTLLSYPADCLGRHTVACCCSGMEGTACEPYW